MYIIKQIPEDFIVMEIPLLKFDISSGKKDYSYYILKKKNKTTMDAVLMIAEKLKISPKKIGFAGNKDKKAVTEQYISIQDTNIRSLSLKGLSMSLVGYGEKPICLGDLRGNKFVITVRDVTDIPELPKKIRMLNLFDSQRFSINNSDIGKAILKKDFKKAVELALEGNGMYEDVVEKYIRTNPNDFVGALKRIPKKILTMFINSYQALLWNRAAMMFSDSKTNFKIPLVGFGTEFSSKKIEGIFMDFLREDNISQRDFIVREIPEISSEGAERDLFAYIDNIKYSIEDDELNRGRKKIIMRFSLPKASYATRVVKEVFKELDVQS